MVLTFRFLLQGNQKLGSMGKFETTWTHGSMSKGFSKHLQRLADPVRMVSGTAVVRPGSDAWLLSGMLFVCAVLGALTLVLNVLFGPCPGNQVPYTIVLIGVLLLVPWLPLLGYALVRKSWSFNPEAKLIRVRQGTIRFDDVIAICVWRRKGFLRRWRLGLFLRSKNPKLVDVFDRMLEELEAGGKCPAAGELFKQLRTRDTTLVRTVSERGARKAVLLLSRILPVHVLEDTGDGYLVVPPGAMDLPYLDRVQQNLSQFGVDLGAQPRDIEVQRSADEQLWIRWNPRRSWVLELRSVNFTVGAAAMNILLVLVVRLADRLPAFLAVLLLLVAGPLILVVLSSQVFGALEYAQPSRGEIIATHWNLHVRYRDQNFGATVREVPLASLQDVRIAARDRGWASLMFIAEDVHFTVPMRVDQAYWTRTMLECFWLRVQPADLPPKNDNPRPELVLIQGQKEQEEKKP